MTYQTYENLSNLPSGSDFNQLSKAIKIATLAHDGQFDKGGMPYILHPLHVMNQVREYGEEAMIIAVLHDVVEDTCITLESLQEAGFSNRVLNAITYLTHRKEVSYDGYINIISLCFDKIIPRIKMEDIRHNSDIMRLKGLTEKDFKRIERYQKAFTLLKGVL